MFHKRIVVDFDDTLAFHQKRKFDEAAANKPLIDKLNKLYDQGWQIDIFTARGSISCETREKARQKYEDGMKTWLKRHNVKYHMLSFDKPLAAYYIDDKGITPEDFLKVDIRDLEGGLSGSEIYTDGKVVHKQDKNAHATREWFRFTQKIGIKTPTVHRVVGDTITMDYIDNDENYFVENFHMALAIIQTQLEAMKCLAEPDELTFESYVKRIKEHANNAYIDSGYSIFQQNAQHLKEFDLQRSFSHGDFGIKNMLFKNCGVTLIDPVCDVFGCTELDVAKFIASLIINQYDANLIKKSFDYMVLTNDITRNKLLVLTVAEITRVYKYHPNKKFIMECAKYVYEYLGNR
jgi:thiamine kinase-like enzyme